MNGKPIGQAYFEQMREDNCIESLVSLINDVTKGIIYKNENFSQNIFFKIFFRKFLRIDFLQSTKRSFIFNDRRCGLYMYTSVCTIKIQIFWF